MTPPFLHIYLTKHSFGSVTPPFLHINSTKIFFCIIDISISAYLLDQNIPSHPWHLHFFASTRPEYSIVSSTPQFLRIYSTRIIHRIPDTSISLYLLDQNNPSHPRHLHFFVPTWPEWSVASLTPQFLRFFSTEIFYRILDTSISSYLLDQNIQLHPRQFHFFVSTRPEYSIASSTPPFLRIFSTRIIYRIIDKFISLYLLDQNILSDPRHLHFFVPSRPEHSIASLKTQFLCIYSTEIFHCILDTSCSSYLLDQNILSHPLQIHFFVSTRPEYSIASLTPPFFHIYSTEVFSRIRDTFISTDQLDRNILSHPLHLHFFVPTRPEYSIASSTPQFLRILNTSISSYLLDQNNPSHPRHLHFFVSTRPE